MTRRALLGAAAGVLWPRRECMVLEAIAAENLPHRVLVRGVEPAAFFELREYAVSAPRMIEIWNRHGIKAVWEHNGRFLIPFQTLTARERAWRELSLDAEWIRNEKKVDLIEVTLYRTSPMRQRGVISTPQTTPD